MRQSLGRLGSPSVLMRDLRLGAFLPGESGAGPAGGAPGLVGVTAVLTAVPATFAAPDAASMPR